jgi:hypothetical protein
VTEQAAARFTPELARRLAEREAQLMLRQELDAVAKTQIEKAVARAAAEEVKKDALSKALVAGGTTLAAAALRLAVTGGAADTPGAAPADVSTIASEVGCVHLLKLYDNADITKLPQLYAEADYSRFSPERPGGFRFSPDPEVRQKIYHLGVIRCLPVN